jgi:large subunit ribosomal protein L5
MNNMREIRIEKLTLNLGAGKNPELLKKGLSLLKKITGMEPIKTFTKKRIPTWGLRPGLPIGCKITLRKENAKTMLKNLLESKDNMLSEKQFDDNGSVSFGIPEYITIPGIKYDPEIGIIGLEACVTLERPGFRIKRRRLGNHKVPSRHKITKQDAIQFMEKHFGVKVSS